MVRYLAMLTDQFSFFLHCICRVDNVLLCCSPVFNFQASNGLAVNCSEKTSGVEFSQNKEMNTVVIKIRWNELTALRSAADNFVSAHQGLGKIEHDFGTDERSHQSAIYWKIWTKHNETTCNPRIANENGFKNLFFFLLSLRVELDFTLLRAQEDLKIWKVLPCLLGLGDFDFGRD